MSFVKTRLQSVKFRPLTEAKGWRDLESLFGARGASGGCWCMWWRLRRSEFLKGRGAPNKRALQRVVASGAPTGVLAYSDGVPVGWCAVAPREHYPVLQRSRVLAPIDDQAVWSVGCFFVARGWRRRGLTVQLLRAAVDFARKKGAEIVEGYPIEPRSSKAPDVFVFTGLASAFRRAGFKELARRSESRPIMRISL